MTAIPNRTPLIDQVIEALSKLSIDSFVGHPDHIHIYLPANGVLAIAVKDNHWVYGIYKDGNNTPILIQDENNTPALAELGNAESEPIEKVALTIEAIINTYKATLPADSTLAKPMHTTNYPVRTFHMKGTPPNNKPHVTNI